MTTTSASTVPTLPSVNNEPGSRRAARPAVTLARILLLAAAIVFVASVPAMRDAKSTDFGLLFAGVPGFAVAIVLAALGFCSAVRRGNVLDTAIAVGVYSLVFRLPVALATEIPIGPATYKLLGVIDYITHNGGPATGVDIYNSWAGAFTTIAWVSQVTGIAPIDLAQWFPVVMELAFAAAVYALARAFGQKPMVALVAALIAQTVNWVGQDYMSPQAVVILLALVILTLLVGSVRRPILGWVSVPLYAAVVVTHQLTPYWLLGIVLVLGATGHIRPRWLGVVYGVIAGSFLVLNYGALSIYGLFSGSSPLANANVIVNGSSSAGLDFTGLAIKITSVLLWGGALLVAAYRVKKARALGGTTWTVLVFAFSSIALLFAQNYGGEAIFRVYLYSIAGCAILLAPALYAAIQVRISSPGRVILPVLGSAVVVVLALSSAQAFYGGWFSLVVGRDAVSSMSTLLKTTPAPATIVALAPTAPNRPVAEYTDFARLDRNFDESLPILYPDWAGSDFPAGSAAEIAAQYTGIGHPVYLMVTKGAIDYNAYYQLYPTGAMERLVEELRNSPDWDVVTDTATVQLFSLRASER